MKISVEKETNQVETSVALPIWMGTRLLDYSDLEEFVFQFHSRRIFKSYNIQDLRDVDMRQIYGKHYLSGLRNLFAGIKRILSEAETKIAIFYIITANVAESNWFPILRRLVSKNFAGCPAYTIIAGGGFKNICYLNYSEDDPYSPEESRAHELDAVYSYFDGDAPTAGMSRLMEMMNRIMGCDLPDQKFPNYNSDDLCRLAWHVCRENFNSCSSRVGAIPKYKIGPNGRPMFNVKKGL